MDFSKGASATTSKLGTRFCVKLQLRSGDPDCSADSRARCQPPAPPPRSAGCPRQVKLLTLCLSPLLAERPLLGPTGQNTRRRCFATRAGPSRERARSPGAPVPAAWWLTPAPPRMTGSNDAGAHSPCEPSLLQTRAAKAPNQTQFHRAWPQDRNSKSLSPCQS